MKPVISVIIPAYNEEQYIDACLRSILHQTIRIPYEIIAVDNNSTDATAEKVKTFCDVILLSEPIQGAPAARNAGVRKAKGTIVVFVDADCIIPKNHLAHVMRLFTIHTKVDAVAGPYVLHDGGPIVRWFTDELNYYAIYYNAIRRWFQVQSFSGGNVAIKKSVFQKVNGFDERLTQSIMCDDTELAVRMTKLGYTIVFDPTLKVMSSFRRMKRAPLSTQIGRLSYGLRYLFEYRHYRLNHSV